MTSEWRVGHLALKGEHFSGRFRTIASGPDYIACVWEEPVLLEVPYRFIDTGSSAGQNGSHNEPQIGKLPHVQP